MIKNYITEEVGNCIAEEEVRFLKLTQHGEPVPGIPYTSMKFLTEIFR